jgi:hypothetical protein
MINAGNQRSTNNVRFPARSSVVEWEREFVDAPRHSAPSGRRSRFIPRICSITCHSSRRSARPTARGKKEWLHDRVSRPQLTGGVIQAISEVAIPS